MLVCPYMGKASLYRPHQSVIKKFCICENELGSFPEFRRTSRYYRDRAKTCYFSLTLIKEVDMRLSRVAISKFGTGRNEVGMR